MQKAKHKGLPMRGTAREFGDTQRHGKKIHKRRESTYVAISTDFNDIVDWYYGKLHQWTESLST